MNDQGESPAVRAQAVMNGVKLGPPELRELQKLEREVARAGDQELARRIRSRRRERDVALAPEILRGAALPRAEMLALAKRLAEYKELGLARRVLKLARKEANNTTDAAIFVELFQKSALYTYKDPDLPTDWRLEQGLEILGGAEDLATTTDPETLGIAGAIFKRKWELDGQRQNLERSLFYYLKGYAQGAPEADRSDVLGYLRRNRGCTLNAERDRGYCGINAAFILDLLASEEEEEARRIGIAPSAVATRRADAALIREEVIRSVPPLRDKERWLNDEWWYYATIGEAFFGLDRYADAIKWLKTEPANAGLRVGFDQSAPAGLDVPEWEYESTARQLARLARLRGGAHLTEAQFESSAAGTALREFLAQDEAAVRSAFRGKFGLGLSGGGFRASLFHIGTLACLAEHDLLRHVEVLSCVSGGSIIGAHYYLKVRQLLESKPDCANGSNPTDAITADDYVRIVQEIEQEFLTGVQRNIRTRVLAELWTNLKLCLWPGYSRTLRVGELYESELFARVKDGHTGERFLDELFIQPKLPDGTRQEDFHPRNHNWRRRHKVPTLILNAACLNTGHMWQFTASYMGEPAMPIRTDIDCNDRMRRMYYRHAPEAHRKIRLGHAVAASSCVPGLFEPLSLEGLYPDRTVQLVDGGVCDNQGIWSLLEQDCTVLLISDGSGQMETEASPSASTIGVPLRSNSILQARVRETQYADVNTRRRAWLLRGLLFVHLKQDLPGEAIAWNECPADLKVSDFERQRSARDRTEYGVAITTQKQLAAIRTDLDSFNDCEAYALMASAYRITEQLLGPPTNAIEGSTRTQARTRWRFLSVDRDLEPDGPQHDQLEHTLSASDKIAFKVWSLSRPLIALKWAAAALIAAGAAYAIWSRYHEPVIPVSLTTRLGSITIGGFARFLVTSVALLLVTRVLMSVLDGKAKYLVHAVKPKETLRRIAVGGVMSLVGWLFARLHLHVFDPIYLRYGRVPPS